MRSKHVMRGFILRIIGELNAQRWKMGETDYCATRE